MRTKTEILDGMDPDLFDARCRVDFKFFCERMLNLTSMGGIHDFQLEWIRLIKSSRNTVIEAPSGSSKSEIAGVAYPLWVLFCNPKKKLEILLVSKTIAQSEKNLLVRLQGYIQDNEFLKNALVPKDARVSWTKTGIRTVNGSTVTNVPYNLNIKGYRAHLIICHPPGTKIYCKQGSKDIKDVEEGDEVLTMDNTFQKVTKKMERKTTERLYEIHSKDIKLKATHNHPIYIERGGYFMFVDAKKVKVGDKIAFPTGGRFREMRIKKIGKFEYPEKIKVDMEIAELLGYFVAEGCIRDKDIGFTFNVTETDYINRVVYLLEKYFGKVTIDKHKESSTNLFLSRIAIRDLFMRTCGKGAHNKKIPSQIMASPNHVKFKFLEALINGDGHWGKNATTISTVSEKLADDLVILLNSLGISAKKNFYNPKTTFGGNGCFHIRIGVNEANAIKTWANASIGRKYLWSTVDKVEIKRAHGKVYNLSVEENNTYVANGMIVHNCDEADSYEDLSIYFKHVVSRPHPGGKIVLITTPEGVSKLVGQLKDKKPVSYVFHKTTVFRKKDGSYVSAEDVNDISDLVRLKDQGAYSIWPENEKYSFDYMMEEFEALGRWSWVQNYLCEIIGETEDTAFTIGNIVATYDPTLSFNYDVNQEAMYFIGADFAISEGPRADYDAYVVVELLGDHFTVKSIETHKGVQRPQKIRRLKELYEHFYSTRGTRIVADVSNMGTMVMNDLRTAGCTVIPQSFTGGARLDLIQTLSNVFQARGALTIPKDPLDESCKAYVNELQSQLTGFRRAKTEKGNETYLSKAAHDDIAISLAMAIKEATKQITVRVKPQTR